MSSKFPKQGCGGPACISCSHLKGEGPWCGRCGRDQDGTYNEFKCGASENGWAEVCYECLVYMGWRTCGYAVPDGLWRRESRVREDDYMEFMIIETDMYGYEYTIGHVREWTVADNMIESHNKELDDASVG